MDLYIMDNSDNLVDVLSSDITGQHTSLTRAIVDEQLNSYDELSFTFIRQNDRKIDPEDMNSVIFKDIRGWREYLIREIEDSNSGVIEHTVYAELSSIELRDEIVRFETYNSTQQVGRVLESLLNGTRWTIGTIDLSIPLKVFDRELKDMNVLGAIDELLAHYECEVTYTFEMDDNRISRRMVNLHKQAGQNNGKRFEWRKDLNSIKRTIDRSEIKTAVYLQGNEQEDGTITTIRDIEWSVSKGDPVDKPFGQEWIGDPEALILYGRLTSENKKRHRFDLLKYNVNSPLSLALIGWDELERLKQPKTTYEAVAVDLYAITKDDDLKHEYARIGDLVTIIDRDLGIVVQKRVVEATRDLLDALNNSFVFGDSKDYFKGERYDDVLNEQSRRIQQLEDRYNALINPEEPDDEKPDELPDGVNENLLLMPFNKGGRIDHSSSRLTMEKDDTFIYVAREQYVDARSVDFPIDKVKIEDDEIYTLSFELLKFSEQGELDGLILINGTEISAVRRRISAAEFRVGGRFSMQYKGSELGNFIRMQIRQENNGKLHAVAKIKSLKLEKGEDVTEFNLHKDDIVRNFIDKEQSNLLKQPILNIEELEFSKDKDATETVSLAEDNGIGLIVGNRRYANIKPPEVTFPVINGIKGEEVYTLSFKVRLDSWPSEEINQLSIRMDILDMNNKTTILDYQTVVLRRTYNSIVLHRNDIGKVIEVALTFIPTGNAKEVAFKMFFDDHTTNNYAINFYDMQVKNTPFLTPWTEHSSDKSKREKLSDQEGVAENWMRAPLKDRIELYSTGGDDSKPTWERSGQSKRTHDLFFPKQDSTFKRWAGIHLPVIEVVDPGLYTFYFEIENRHVANDSGRKLIEFDIQAVSQSGSGVSGTLINKPRFVWLNPGEKRTITLTFPIKMYQDRIRARITFPEEMGLSEGSFKVSTIMFTAGYKKVPWIQHVDDIVDEEEVESSISDLFNRVETMQEELFNTDGSSRLNSLEQMIAQSVAKEQLIKNINDSVDQGLINQSRVESPGTQNTIVEIGSARTVEGGTVISLSEAFKQERDEAFDYQVFIQAYSNSNVWVATRTKDAFSVVSNDTDIPFGYKVEAMQK